MDKDNRKCFKEKWSTSTPVFHSPFASFQQRLVWLNLFLPLLLLAAVFLAFFSFSLANIVELILLSRCRYGLSSSLYQLLNSEVKSHSCCISLYLLLMWSEGKNFNNLFSPFHVFVAWSKCFIEFNIIYK